MSGSHAVTLREDGTFTGNRADWTFRTAAPGGAVVVTIDALDGGTWSATDDQLTINDQGGDAEVDFAIEQGGQLVPVPVAPSQAVGGWARADRHGRSGR